MKKYLFSLFCTFICVALTQAQPTLYGLTANGGADGVGTVLQYKPASSTMTPTKSFQNFAAANPQGDLMTAADGKLYGMTTLGGIGYGTIFSFDPATNKYTVLKSFDSLTGAHPYGSLIQTADGQLYGMTSGGGSNNLGVIFSYDPTYESYTVLKSFTGNGDGAHPYGSLILGYHDILYGMTSEGGAVGQGVVFSFSLNSKSYGSWSFNGTNGAHPYGNLLQAVDGTLYGMTPEGGSRDAGVIFSIPFSGGFTVLHNFESGGKGGNPYGSLVQGIDGNLYGTTYLGGTLDGYLTIGPAFSFNPATKIYTLTNYENWSSIPYGYHSKGSLMQGADGKLYGLTAAGGANNAGAIFSYSTNGSSWQVLYSFGGASGSNPFGSLVKGSDGKLYGMTSKGGGNNVGVLFALDPTNSSYAVLKNFGRTDGTTTSTGKHPQGSFLQASDGRLYSATFDGGANNAGVLFSFDPTNSSYAVLKNFEVATGSGSPGSLTQASDSKLYGTSFYGGPKGNGVIWSFDLSANQYAIVKAFDGTTGANPASCPVQASDGKLYGTTNAGGSNGVGVLYSLSTEGSYTILKTFDGTTGSNPYASLLQASDRKLYGTTYAGGSNGVGVLYSFDPATSSYTVLKNFDGATGAGPGGSLIQGCDKKLYGLASAGGSSGLGVIFSFEPSTGVYTALKNFDGATGATPYGGLLQASDGKLYGLTSGGGSHGVGVAFSFDPDTGNFSASSLDEATGHTPQLASFIEPRPLPTITTSALTDTIYLTGAALNVPYTITGSYTNGNTFTAQLSDSAGAFDHPTTIGSVNATTSGNIPATIPMTVPLGNHYRVRVVSSAPVTTGSDNGRDLNITEACLAGPQFPATTFTPSCTGSAEVITTEAQAGQYSLVNLLEGNVYTFSSSVPTDYVSLATADGTVKIVSSPGSSFALFASYNATLRFYLHTNSNCGTSESLRTKSITCSKVTPAITNVTVLSGNCVVSSRVINADVSTNSSTLTSVTLNYNNGTAGSIPMSLTAGSTYIGTIPAGTAGVPVTWSITAVNSYGGSKVFTGNTYTDGVRPPKPVTACYQTATFNGTTCSWDVTGTQPTKPTTACYETATFNTATCQWDVKGIIPPKPLLACYQTATFNGTSCSWDVTGTQPAKPPQVNCWDDYQFSSVTCSWVNLGSQPAKPTTACSAQATFNPTTCQWDVPALTTYYADADGDGFGNAAISIQSCILPLGYASNNVDCDDTKAAIHPNTLWYKDADGDGYYSGSAVKSCISPGAGYRYTDLVAGGDCNDANARVHPNATEICGNGIDDNCDGQIDEGCNNKLLVSISDATVYESAGTVSLTISLSKKSLQPVSVSYTTVDGTAKSKGNKNSTADFTAAGGTVVIPAGELATIIRIAINNDNVQEPGEQFSVQLSKPINAGIDKGVSTVTIFDGEASLLAARKVQSIPEADFSSKLSVQAFPNPSSTAFTLQLQGTLAEPVSLQVMDIMGRVVDRRTSYAGYPLLVIGQHYRAGVYVVYVIQGSRTATLKLIKQ